MVRRLSHAWHHDACMCLHVNRRWAMEIVSIQEFRNYQDNLRNVIIMLAKVGAMGG